MSAPIVRDVMAAIAARDWDALTLLLHPYLTSTGPARTGRTIRGRRNLLAHLAATPAARPPSRYELRDGQVYRWVERGAGPPAA